MFIVFYIFMGLIFFGCLIACFSYFRKESRIAQRWIEFEQDEEELNYRETLKSTRQGIRLLKVT